MEDPSVRIPYTYDQASGRGLLNYSIRMTYHGKTLQPLVEEEEPRDLTSSISTQPLTI